MTMVDISSRFEKGNPDLDASSNQFVLQDWEIHSFLCLCQGIKVDDNGESLLGWRLKKICLGSSTKIL